MSLGVVFAAGKGADSSERRCKHTYTPMGRFVATDRHCLQRRIELPVHLDNLLHILRMPRDRSRSIDEGRESCGGMSHGPPQIAGAILRIIKGLEIFAILRQVIQQHRVSIVGVQCLERLNIKASHYEGLFKWLIGSVEVSAVAEIAYD